MAETAHLDLLLYGPDQGAWVQIKIQDCAAKKTWTGLGVEQVSFSHMALSLMGPSFINLACCGHALIQAQHRIQSAAMVANPLSASMAFDGHAAAQIPHSVHASVTSIKSGAPVPMPSRYGKFPGTSKAAIFFK